MISTLSVENKYYKQPYQIGDVLEYESKYFLIIGIQKISAWGNSLKITYIVQDTCLQNLKTDYNSKVYMESLNSFFAEIKTDERVQKRLDHARLGEIFYFHENAYRIMEYTDVRFEFTDIIITFLAKKIFIASREVVKKKMLDLKKEQSGLIVIK